MGGERTNRKGSEKIEEGEEENEDREREIKECKRGRYGIVNMRKRERDTGDRDIEKEGKKSGEKTWSIT